jgi:hypothetical protein
VDHKEQHHQHHEKEREEKKKEQKEYEREQEQKPYKIHPAWFVGAGITLTVLAVLVWITFFR